MTVEEVKVIDLTWDRRTALYTFRLMEGKKYITPKLPMTPFDFFKLKRYESLELDGWVKMRQDRLSLAIFLMQPKIRPWSTLEAFYSLYRVAQDVRGCKPEEGWHEVYQKQLDQEKGW